MFNAQFEGDPRADKSGLIIAWISRALLTLLPPVCSPKGPCHVELQRALDKITKSQQILGDKLTRFYLPNCDKHGLYKPKQVGACREMRLWVSNDW